MDARERLQEDHAEADALQGVQDAEPEPQTASNEGGSDGPTGPGNVLADVGGAPEHLAPSGRAQTDGEDGQDPRMIFAKDAEEPEEGGPHDAEEQNAEKHDLPWLSEIARPQISPVTTVWGGEPVVLDHDGDEKPEDDLAACQRRVE